MTREARVIPSNPFEAVESLLQNPVADGIFVTHLSPNSKPAAAGLLLGDIIVEIESQPLLDFKSFFQALKPKGEDDRKRRVRLVRSGGAPQCLEVPTTTRGLGACYVRQGESAWITKPDYEGPPDFSAFSDGAEMTLRNSFGEEPAGFEIIRLKRMGEFLEVTTFFRLGGEAAPGETWEHFTRGQTTHRLNKSLGVVKTAFWEGRPLQEKLTGSMVLNSDGLWRGEHHREGVSRKVEFRAEVPDVLTGYTATLLPLSMPLRTGACFTFAHAADGNARPTCRERMECLGRRKTQVERREVEAWCFAWRHYGHTLPEEDEHFYVSDDRRLLRIDWGSGYNYCWCEAVPKARLMEGVPKNVILDL